MATLQRELSRQPTLSRMPTDFDASECPICFEINGGEIMQLVHAINHEAIKTHKACLSCRILLKQENAPCPWCRDTVLYVAGSNHSIIVNPEPEEIIQLPDGIKQSPCCGILVQRISGSAEMMCGCEAKPAGGTLFKALRGGGCGHEWNWDTMGPIAYGIPGTPAHPRQTKYGGWNGPPPEVPCCGHGKRADEECPQCPPPWAMNGGEGRAVHAQPADAQTSRGCCGIM